jgi:hypothetical protein
VVPPEQLIVKLIAAPAATDPDGAPMMEQLSAPGGVAPQVIVKLPPPLSTTEHALGKLRFPPTAGVTAIGETNKKTNVALASTALARATKDRIMCSPCVGKRRDPTIARLGPIDGNRSELYITCSRHCNAFVIRLSA